MDVRIGKSLVCYIATDPQLTFTRRGEARFYARAGQQQFQELDEGGFEKTGKGYTDVVMYRATAEAAYEKLRKGDNVILSGDVHTYDFTRDDGTVEQREEFVATGFGPNGVLTDYTVDRSRQRDMALEQTAGPRQDRVAERHSTASAPLAL